MPTPTQPLSPTEDDAEDKSFCNRVFSFFRCCAKKENTAVFPDRSETTNYSSLTEEIAKAKEYDELAKQAEQIRKEQRKLSSRLSIRVT